MTGRLTPGARAFLGLAAAAGTAIALFANRRLEEEGDDGADVADAAAAALRELRAWTGLTETDPAAAGLLAPYWAAVGMAPQPPSIPWSAAFISYAAGAALNPNASHVGYARDALADRKLGLRGRYWAYEPSELAGALEPGDILIRGRGEPLSWADLEQGSEFIPAHGDVVVRVEPGAVEVVGGNLGDSVSRRRYAVSEWAPDGVVAVLRKVA